NRGRTQFGGVELFQQRFAAAGGIGGDEDAAGIAGKEALQRLARLVVLFQQRQSRGGLVAERCAVLGRHVDAQAAVEAGPQFVRREEQLRRRQQRPLDVVAALRVALAGLLPERRGGFMHALGQHRQRARRQVVEQGG